MSHVAAHIEQGHIGEKHGIPRQLDKLEERGHHSLTFASYLPPA